MEFQSGTVKITLRRVQTDAAAWLINAQADTGTTADPAPSIAASMFHASRMLGRNDVNDRPAIP